MNSYHLPPWYPIDVAGTIFPSARTRRWNSTFRIAFLLGEDVDPERLRAALADARRRFPSFFAGLRHGLFWYYIQPMGSVDVLEPEADFPCRPMNMFDKTRPALHVYYDRRRLAVEISHFIADGGAGLVFAKALLALYLGKELPGAPHAGELEDSFRKNYSKNASKPAAARAAWRYRPPVQPGYLKLIHAAIPAEDILPLAKARKLTLTDYLLGIYFYAFYLADPCAKKSRKPIQISVPINLRNHYPSETLRNFCLFANVGFDPRAKENCSLGDIFDAVKGQLEAANTKEEMHKLLCANGKMINSLPARLVPNVLKRRVMQAGYFLTGERRQTSSMSNLGRLNLPPGLARHVESVEFVTGHSPMLPLKMTVISDDRFVHLYFPSASPKTDVQREFVRILAGEGARIFVECNIREGKRADVRCPACGVDLKQSICPLCGGAAEDTPPLIEGVAWQDYPAYESNSAAPGGPVRRKGGGERLPLREKIKAFFHF